ncbi:MAG: hypothetical protein EOP24_27435 [Hyphomicrobiales bacterium]|nr:MAG: hypothetical protein EOP24_27435 [Hyphomicrobiales bacterium]
MKKYIWALWVALLLVVGLAVVAALVCLARQPTEPGAASPVPAKLQLVAAVVAPLGAIFTTLGVSVALFVAIRDSRRFAQEERRRRREDTERRADQARLIQITTWDQHAFQQASVEVTFRVDNHSASPILDASCEIPASITDRVTLIDTLVSTSPFTPAVTAGQWHSWSIKCDPDVAKEVRDTVFIAFTDAAGVRWTRTWNQPPVLADPAGLDR